MAPSVNGLSPEPAEAATGFGRQPRNPWKLLGFAESTHGSLVGTTPALWPRMSATVVRKERVVLPSSSRPDEQTEMTLLDLVMAVADSADSDEEVVATISSLLSSGQVLLIGNFCDEALDEKPD